MTFGICRKCYLRSFILLSTTDRPQPQQKDSPRQRHQDECVQCNPQTGRIGKDTRMKASITGSTTAKKTFISIFNLRDCLEGKPVDVLDSEAHDGQMSKMDTDEGRILEPKSYMQRRTRVIQPTSERSEVFSIALENPLPSLSNQFR